jgi:N12 class adenine-specific DNA methylase/predicted RNA methylase
VRYVGWGGLPQAFDHRNSEWSQEYKQLASMLSREEYEKARRSTQDAHYTPASVVSAIYQGLSRIGFTGGRVMDPAVGTGHFVGLMPDAMRERSTITAIELDPLTADIGQRLYPSITFINRGFEKVTVPTDHFDVVVGNPPYGSQSLYDQDHRDLSDFSIHNFFIAKSLDKLRPGGVLAVVVSRYFMDAANGATREHLAERAHLLGAIRLPNNTFSENALTEVTTDIVFLQKAAPGETLDTSWTALGAVIDYASGEEIPINAYFAANPRQMLGNMALVSGPHGAKPELLPSVNARLDDALTRALDVLPQHIYRPVDTRPGRGVETVPELELPAALKIGSFFLAPNGKLAKRLPDVLDKHNYEYHESRNARAEERAIGMVGVRDAMRALMDAELTDLPEPEVAALRVALNQVYDRFVKKHGHISAQVNRLVMSEDPAYPLLQALERDYDKGVSADLARKHGTEARPPKADKAAIFSRRVMTARREITSVDSPKDALVVSMNERGRVDMDLIVRLCGKSEADVVTELRGRIFVNPDSREWEIADRYLTGNVKAKLASALAAAESDPAYQENVASLRKVQPADIDAVDIAIQLGSTWVPADYVKGFVTHLLGDVTRTINYQPAIGKWIARVGDGDPTTCRGTWGTQRYPANDLIEAILKNSSIQVKDEVGRDEGNRPIMRLNEQETAAACQKADEIRQAFLDWIWEDKDRREHLVRTYNDNFNTTIAPVYDGSHLTLLGASLGVSLRPHQKNSIWRGIQDGFELYDHVVGAGKTFAAVGTAMESKRMGLLSKPMFVVPNHLTMQWKDEFYALYPNANILVADKSDFKKENRERLFARIATNDWDAVIVAHSSFKKIGMPADTLEEILQEQIDDLTTAIMAMKEEHGDRVTIKEMEKAKERMTERMKRAADTGNKDLSVTFDELGVDAVFVDEAHMYKGLQITTTLSRISGLGNLEGSDMAFDLFVKCRYLQKKNNGRGVFFATGTPISNTIAELYTMQRYLAYDDMRERGIAHFDAWASTFGQVVTGWELDATGVNYRLNSRFSKFQNVPELVSMYRTFADVITKTDLDRQAEEQGTRFPIPKIKGGRPQNVVVERSEDQAYFMGIQADVLDDEGNPRRNADGMLIKDWNHGSIIHRMENLPKDPRIDNPLKITNEARKAGLDFRLIDPNAEDHPGSKVNACVDRVIDLYERWKEQRGTQLVFCDLSTPKPQKRSVAVKPPDEGDDMDTEAEETDAISMDELLASTGGTFNVYDDLKAKLIAKGIPDTEVRFIHEATTDLQKSKLFDEVNRGDVRVLIGSTAKMGAGTNVQRLLVGQHHLDAPWRPSDLEQRDGRILRQGNVLYAADPDGFEVELYRYATKQTYDSRMWQTIEYKAGSIEQFRRGDLLVRTIDDVAGEAANAAEMKAAATGNPLIFMQVKLDADRKKVEAVYANYKRNQHALEKRADWLRGADARAHEGTRRWTAEIALRDSATTDKGIFVLPGGGHLGEDDRQALFEHCMGTMKDAIDKHSVYERHREVPVGTYRGFAVSVYAETSTVQFVIQGATAYESDNFQYRRDDKFSASGFLIRLDNYFAGFEGRLHDVERVRDDELAELRKATVELDKPFGQADMLEALRADCRDVMTELKLMQADDAYESTWSPRSAELEQSRGKVNETPVATHSSRTMAAVA